MVDLAVVPNSNGSVGVLAKTSSPYPGYIQSSSLDFAFGLGIISISILMINIFINFPKLLTLEKRK